MPIAGTDPTPLVIKRLARFKGPDKDSRLAWPGLGTSFMMWKQKDFRDIPIPPGYKHWGRGKVPLDHMSLKPLQDKVEEDLKRKILETPRGPRRDYYIEELEEWIAAGRPTQTSISPKADKNLFRRTQAKGTGKWADSITHDTPTRRRRIKVADMVGAEPDD